MATDSANLIGQVYDLLASTYAASRSDQAFLAFEALGMPISDGMFKLSPTDKAFSPALAVERQAEIANRIPLIHDSSLNWGLASVDGTISLMLEASEATTAAGMPALGAAKLQAHAKFDTTLGSSSGVPGERFHPVYATPVDWYDASVNANWSSYKVGQDPPPTTQPSPATPPGTPPRRPIRIDPPRWRVVPAQVQPVLTHPVSPDHPLMMVARQPIATASASRMQPTALNTSALLRQRLAPMAHGLGSLSIQPALLSALATAAVSIAPASVKPQVEAIQSFQPLRLAEAAGLLESESTTQLVLSPNISMSFDHCIVTLRRPWWPDMMMMLRNWYLPSYNRGDLSQGSGSSDPGMMPVVTTGFVAIRNLRISAQWSQADLDAMQKSASFGPFSLIGRNIDPANGTLSCPGIQIIGWFCAALPVLPPAADPSLPGQAPAPTGAAADGGTSSATTAPAGATTTPVAAPDGAPSSPPAPAPAPGG